MEHETRPSTPLKTQLSRSLLDGVIMSVAAVLIWFLLSRSARTLGMWIAAALLLLAAFNLLCFSLVKRAGKGLRALAKGTLVIVNVAALLWATLYPLASSQLFYPHFDEASYAALQTREGAEELSITAEGQSLSGWMLHNADGRAPLVLYFAGNGENASRRILSLMDKNQQTPFAGYNLVCIDYPGYGKSGGSPSEGSLKRMGLAVYDALAERSDVSPDQIVVLGYSLGTGVANYVASNREAAGLVLMAPYADGYDLFNGMVDIFYGPLRLLVSFRMESVRFAENIHVKPLLLASKDDELIPYESSLRLSEAYPGGCRLETLEGLGHNDFWGSPEVLAQISDYLSEVKANG